MYFIFQLVIVTVNLNNTAASTAW